MPTLDPRTNQVTIGGFRFTQFADTSTHKLTGEDGFAAKAGVGGTVGFVRVRNPLANLVLDLMQGSADITAMEALLETSLETNVGLPVLIVDTLRPTQIIVGTARPVKRPDDPGIGTEIQTISYEFHVAVETRRQGSSVLQV